MPDDDEGRAAGHLLRTAMDSTNLRQLQHWISEQQPRLTTDWDRVAGASNTRVDVTPEEAEAIMAGIEQLLAPFVHRTDDELPAGTGTVRFLRYVMPQLDDAVAPVEPVEPPDALPGHDG